jgi:hypothetical protein
MSNNVHRLPPVRRATGNPRVAHTRTAFRLLIPSHCPAYEFRQTPVSMVMENKRTLRVFRDGEHGIPGSILNLDKRGGEWQLSCAAWRVEGFDDDHFFGSTECVLESVTENSFVVILPETLQPTRRRGKQAQRVLKAHNLHEAQPKTTDAALTGLRAAVRTINEYKDQLGSDLVISVDGSTGKLETLVRYS